MVDTIYDFTVKAQDGSSKSLGDYRGKVLLVVNTATGCGFTPQYSGLEELYQKYRDQGFEILDFPCNQFAGQAPGSDDEIHEFCVGRFAMTFPQFSKIDVNGTDADPLYVWLRREQGGIGGGRIKWNFTKFLIDRDGHAVDRFAPQTTPEQLDGKVARGLTPDLGHADSSTMLGKRESEGWQGRTTRTSSGSVRWICTSPRRARR